MIYQTVSILAPVLSFLVIYCNGAAVTIATPEDRGENLIQEDVDYTTTKVGFELEDGGDERVDIVYNSTIFKEIDQDILQIVGKPSIVSLTCHSNKNNGSFVDWYYHGIGGSYGFDSVLYEQNDVILNLATFTPPVCRMECVLQKNETIRNNTLVYTGDGNPPYLHNHGESVRATVLNETTANLPCILNYHIENLSNLELQLFKDGNMVENKNNCLSYTPENGFFLNLTLLDSPLGKYECKVVNSTKEDIVTVELREDNYIRVNYTGYMDYFYATAPEKREFQCTLPKDTFKNEFRWYFLLNNESIDYINDIPANETEDASDSLHYSQKIKVTFPTVDITHIGCYGFAQDSSLSFNNSMQIVVKKPSEPTILNGSSKVPKPVVYSKGKNLTCATYADPVNWTWFQNGVPIKGANISDVYNSSPVRRSTLTLNPLGDDREINISCVASNFLGNATYNFRVARPDSPSSPLVVVLLIGFGFITLFVGFLLIFFKWNVTRRQLSKQHIRNFFIGFGANNPPYSPLEDSPEPYASISYDRDREIKYKSLIFERRLQAGNFGQVEFGRLLDTNNHSSIPVAIKSMKNDPKRSKAEMEDAFLNFLNEIKLMQFVGFHRNVVSYIGAVTSDIAKYSAYLVVEYCCGGDLASYLVDHRGMFHDDIHGVHQNSQAGVTMHGNKTILKTSHLLKWAADLAAGLEYISSKHIVHRDLAARNVLLAYPGINSDNDCSDDPGRMIAKIADFGISRNLNGSPSEYYQVVFDTERPEKRVEIPLRWLAIESLESLKFTTQTDVWALGVTLWEMFILGDLPFREVTGDDKTLRFNLISHIKAGNVLAEPPWVHKETWDIMLQCWDENPQKRPTPYEIMTFLHNLNEIENERLQRELQNRDQAESPEIVQQFSFTPYCQVANMDPNLGGGGDSMVMDDLSDGEYSQFSDDDDEEIHEAQSNL